MSQQTTFPPLPSPKIAEEVEEKRWEDLDKLLTRPSPLADPQFGEICGPLVRQFLHDCKILIVGAGGLGCDLVKNLALSGFRNIDIIDMDTIDTSNLNRQFLFRNHDVGKPKSTTAADFVNKRVPGVKVTAHNCMIQDMPLSFYREFKIVICGLDSIEARRWINSTLHRLVKYTDEEQTIADPATVIPYIDGGTEGFKGQARVIVPGSSACFECTLGLLTNDENFPLCTIKSKPRLPEHCIQYALLVVWPTAKGKPGIKDEESFDKDNAKHIQWIYDTACERAAKFNIRGVTYRLTQGVVKRIIPAIASTNAIIASACTNESLKLATLMSKQLDNTWFYNGNGEQGVYTYNTKYAKNPDCPVCGAPKLLFKLKKDITVEEFRAFLCEHPQTKFRAPAIKDGSHTYIYADFNKTMEEQLKDALPKKLSEFVPHGEVAIVSDKGVLPKDLEVTIQYIE